MSVSTADFSTNHSGSIICETSSPLLLLVWVLNEAKFQKNLESFSSLPSIFGYLGKETKNTDEHVIMKKKKTLNKNFVHSTCIGQARALCYKGFFYAFITNVMRIWSFLWILAQCQWLNYYWILTTTEITKPTSIIPFSVEAPVTVTASPSSSPTRILELKVSNFYQSLYHIARSWPSSLLRYFFLKKIACPLVILTI